MGCIIKIKFIPNLKLAYSLFWKHKSAQVTQKINKTKE